MILDELAAHARERVAAAKAKKSLEQIKEDVFSLPKSTHEFSKTLNKSGVSFICEVKKASPSKGIIAEHFPYQEIAREYEAAGADAISVLTEPKWFQGSDTIFKEIRSLVKLPMLRKDFTVDEYQIYEAKTMGADAVLLICAILDTEKIRRYLGICEELGLDALVETHNEEEIQSALEAGAKIVGVNNRNLKNFTVDFSNAGRLRKLIPENVVFVAESGVKTPEDVGALAGIGTDAVLIGETLMRADDKADMLKKMHEVAENVNYAS